MKSIKLIAEAVDNYVNNGQDIETTTQHLVQALREHDISEAPRVLAAASRVKTPLETMKEDFLRSLTQLEFEEGGALLGCDYQPTVFAVS